MSNLPDGYKDIINDTRLNQHQIDNIYVLENGNFMCVDDNGHRYGLFQQSNGDTRWLMFEPFENIGNMRKLSDMIRIKELELDVGHYQGEIKRMTDKNETINSAFKNIETIVMGVS